VLNHSRHPTVGPLHKGMHFATSYHIEMAMRLGTLLVAISSVAQSMLGHLPTEAF
jgi:hypothetical protein